MYKFLRKNSHVIVWIVVVAFLVGGVLFGYGSYVTNRRGNNAPAQQTQKDIAKVNGEEIDAGEYWAKIQASASYLSQIPGNQQLMYRYRILSSIIDNTLLSQKADEMNIKVKVTDEDVQAEVDKVLERNKMTEEELEEYFKNNNRSLKQWKETVRDGLKEQKRIKAVIDSVAEDVTVSEEEIAEEYEKVRVSRIVMPKNVDVEDPKAKITEAKSRIDEGTDFAQVAKDYSKSYDAASGGDLGFIGHDGTNLGKALAEKAFAMKKGEISDVIETETGYTIIKVTDKKTTDDKEFAEKKKEIKKELLDSKKLKAQNEWFEKIKEESEIIIAYPHLAGYEALTSQNYEKAINKFEEVIQNNENSPYYSYLARAYKESGNVDKAIETLKKAVEIHPEDWQTQLSLADTYKGEGMTEKAIEAYKQVSEKAKENRWIHTRLHQVFKELGEEELAQKEADISMELIQKAQEEAKKNAEKVKQEEEAKKQAEQEQKTDEKDSE